MNPVTVRDVIAKLTGPDAPCLLKSDLIDDDGNYCAQGYVLHLSGLKNDRISWLTQRDADQKVADVLNITLSESLLLRIVNDSPNGRAVDALQNHENILGPQAKRILAFWRYLDGLDKECWHEFRDAFVLLNRNQPSYPPMRLAWLFVDRDGSAYEEALEMCARVRIATSQSVWKGSAGVRGNAAKAANEIQAYEAMRPLGYEPHYLPMFGIDALEDLD